MGQAWRCRDFAHLLQRLCSFAVKPPPCMQTLGQRGGLRHLCLLNNAHADNVGVEHIAEALKPRELQLYMLCRCAHATRARTNARMQEKNRLSASRALVMVRKCYGRHARGQNSVAGARAGDGSCAPLLQRQGLRPGGCSWLPRNVAARR